jgi:transposase
MPFKEYSTEFKYEVVIAYKTEAFKAKEICSIYQIPKGTLYDWVEKFNLYGTEGLENSIEFKSYSKELKESAVLDYLSGKYSQNEVVRKYKISSRGVLCRWINKYNSHRELRDTPKGSSDSMTKGRKTTKEERLEIVTHCLENGKNYAQTAEAHQVSYQQVYQWVRKFEIGGTDALKDGRGRTKEEEELSSEEKVNLEMKKLEKENERLRMENAFLKKLKEIERRRR